MKLKVGMYARVKELNSTSIIKVVAIDQFDNDGFKADNNMHYLVSDIIGNPSFNIIDLIECFDIVELYVSGLEEDGVTQIIRPETLNELKKLKKYIENGAKIKSIITKEQFDSMKYEV